MDLPPDSLQRLNQTLLEFARERDWEQFHSPKNLSMALIAEAAELVEHFQWLSQEQSYLRDQPEKKAAVAEELADILIFLIRAAERLDIDLIAAAEAKILRNQQRYPAERVRGDARRASEYGPGHAAD
ncbi:MAG: nucleotide pyrophosphohydrolase [Gammaproteobacteria bacterium SHHR-1]